MKSRAYRRVCDIKRKAQVKAVVQHVWREPELAQDAQWIARHAAVRGKCSCFFCRPRKAEKGKTKEDAKRKLKEDVEP